MANRHQQLATIDYYSALDPFIVEQGEDPHWLDGWAERGPIPRKSEQWTVYEIPATLTFDADLIEQHLRSGLIRRYIAVNQYNNKTRLNVFRVTIYWR